MGDVRVVKAAHDVDDGVRRADVRKELVAEALTLGRALDKACNVDEFDRGGREFLRLMQVAQPLQTRIRHGHDADIRIDGAEGVIIGGNARICDRVEQRGLADVRQSDDTKFHGLDALAQEAQKAQSQIAAKKAEQQKVLDDAKDNKAAAAQMEQDLIAESKRVHNLIQERLRQQEAARQAASQSGGEAPSYTQGSGVLSWPCNGPITSPYGYRVHPIFGTTIYHSGIDIGVDYGTPIHAADSGTVIYAGWISGYGNAVIIDHGNGMQTLYGHNQSLNVSEGQSVSKGQVIAFAGSTGNSTGPHCHFEVQVNGSAVDPMGYL